MCKQIPIKLKSSLKKQTHGTIIVLDEKKETIYRDSVALLAEGKIIPKFEAIHVFIFLKALSSIEIALRGVAMLIKTSTY